MAVFFIHRDRHRAAPVIIPDGIVAQIIEELLHELTVRIHRTWLSAELHGHVLLSGVHLQHIHTFSRQLIQINIRILAVILPSVQLGKLDDIVDQG